MGVPEMDLEGYARRLMERLGEEGVRERLVERIVEIKGVDREKAERIAEAVIVEVKNAYSKTNPILDYYRSGVKMGEFGVGSRGLGDFYVHEKIAEIAKGNAVISPRDLDDAGVVRFGDLYISVSVDGIHSRLSEFPFIAGFHVTRAAMRDIYVMGAKPVAVFSDIHVADDGDVSKIFDHLAGITAVCEIMNVPLVAGSTLRIGGDMVIGERMTGCVGCVGVSKIVLPRKNVVEGDVILLTEGAGGGTVATAAIYHGRHEIVEETLNVDFLISCEALLESGVLSRVHSMSDVTNGGIRGDAEEIAKVSGKALVFDYEACRRIVNRRVLEMLESLGIDFMGVSIDSLMVICPEEVADDVKNVVKSVGVRIEEVGWVENGKGAYLVEDGKRKPMKPKFRESAYTPIKKVIGEETPENFEEMKRRVDEAFIRAVEKKMTVVERIREKIRSRLGACKA